MDESGAGRLNADQRAQIVETGAVPWAVGHATCTSRARHSLYRRWHNVINDLHRTVEEHDYLKPQEAQRALHYYRAVLRVIRSACSTMQAELEADVTEPYHEWAAARSMLLAKLHVLREHERRCCDLQRRAGALWAYGRPARGRSKAVPGIGGVAAFLHRLGETDAADAAAMAAAAAATADADADGGAADSSAAAAQQPAESDADEDAYDEELAMATEARAMAAEAAAAAEEECNALAQM